MNVLVVEDEPGAREAIVELVRELGYEASGVGTVADASSALVTSGRTSASPTSASPTATGSTSCATRGPPGATAPSWS